MPREWTTPRTGGRMSADQQRRQSRIAKSKAKIRELVNKGVPFNPARVSGFTRNVAIGNAKRMHSNRAVSQVASRTPGSATAPRGGPVTFRPAKSAKPKVR